MLSRRFSRPIMRFIGSASCQPSSSSMRPDLDFDYLLDERNEHEIKTNIANRKQIGDLDALRRIWNKIEPTLADKEKKASMEESEWQYLWDQLYLEAANIPNRSHPSAPVGDESKARVVEMIGDMSKTQSTPRTAEDILLKFKLLQLPRLTCGERSYASQASVMAWSRRPIACIAAGASSLEKALITMALQKALEAGFKPIAVPDVLPTSVTRDCGLVQRPDHHSILYFLRGNKEYCLSGTAEMGIASFFAGQTLSEVDLPLKLVATSRCYRPEISSSKTDAGLYRVHEFTKVELFVVTRDDVTESDAALQELVRFQCDLFGSLGVHCRLLDMPTEELGAPAYRKYDIEAWMPGRKIFGEVSSASNCTDFQSRRLGIKYITKDGQVKFAHTCNGTALASSRSLISIFEGYQNKNALLPLPKILRDEMPEKRMEPFKSVAINPSTSVID